MLTSIGLGRRVDSPLVTTSSHQPIVAQSRKHTKRTSSSSITDDNDFVKVNYRSRPCNSPIRPNSLVLSSQNSSQKNPHEHNVDDDNSEKYYSAQSSKISTPMIHSLGVSSSIKSSNEKLYLSSILDIDSDEQKNHQTKILPPKIDKKYFHLSHDVLEKDFLD